MSVVVPVLNEASFLSMTLPALFQAKVAYGTVDVTFADNGSEDGSIALLESWPGGGTVLTLPRVTVGKLRNHGAAHVRGEYLVFLDADCVIAPDYFQTALSVFESTGCDATGSAVALPTPAHWIERTWAALNDTHRDGDATYINSGNFVVRRVAFERVGGFDESLTSGEDAELCMRLKKAGFRLHASRDVKAVHLGNPKTLRQFFRRELWHGAGAIGTARLARADKPLIGTAVHGFFVLLATAILAAGRSDEGARVVLALLLLSAVPLAAVVYRLGSTKRRMAVAGPGIVLYFLYFTARAVALIASAFSSAPRRRAVRQGRSASTH